MFEYFNAPAKRVMVASQDEATAFGHDFIGTEHLLLALLVVDDGLAGKVLTRDYGMAVEPAREAARGVFAEAGIEANGVQDSKDALSSIGIDVDEIKRRADDTFGPGVFRFPRPAYTARSKKVLEGAVRRWDGLGHKKASAPVGTGHLLLGLLDEESGLSHKLLAAFSVDERALSETVVARLESEMRP